MSQRVIETVTFKLKPGVTREAFQQIASTLNPYVQDCEGFLARRLSCAEDGIWVEHIEWASMEDAKSAAAGIGKDPRNAQFLSAIDAATVTLVHSRLEVSIG